MAWCPKCGSEYVEGIQVCADCGCELAESLAEEDSAEEGAEAGLFFDEAKPEETYRPFYVNNEERAEENRSSGYTLITVGSLGLVLVILVFLEVIDIGMSLTNKYMVTGVMGVLFVLFIVMGTVSMKNSKILRKKATSENNLTKEIKKWCALNFRQSEIDGILNLSGIQEELKYFQRFDYMKAAIRKQFMNLDEGYLDRLIEEVYPDIFEKENSLEEVSENHIIKEKAG